MAKTSGKIALAVHGGAGAPSAEYLRLNEQQCRCELESALEAGYKVLRGNGSAQDAVVASVAWLENCPLFNAGVGSVLDCFGNISMDAALMDGLSKDLGAVTGISKSKNPIVLAQKVLNESEHVLLSGHLADEFGKGQGIAQVDQDHFITAYRQEQLQAAKRAGTVELDHTDDKKLGTVGAVALDRHGHLAAATSTGGLTNKSFGRIGDSPIVGAGTFADDRTVAISCTGKGELFLRHTIAAEVHYRMLYLGESLKQATEYAIHHILPANSGGLIGVDHLGQISMPFNTKSLFRGQVDTAGKVTVEIF